MQVKTPGVYIKETNNFPPSIVETSTAIPVFIGFTEITQPSAVLVTNMLDFVASFGREYQATYKVNLSGPDIVKADKNFYLYDSIDLYFRNGGGPCYVISSGDYATAQNAVVQSLQDAIATIETIDDATIVVVPDVHFKSNGNALNPADYGTLTSEILNVCGSEKDKFAVLDYHTMASDTSTIRTLITSSEGGLKHGGLYYPWLVDAKTSSVSYDSLTFQPAASKPVSSITTEIDTLNADLQLFETAFTTGSSSSALMVEYTRLKGLFDPQENATNQRAALTVVFQFVTDLLFKLETIEQTPNNSTELSGRFDELKADTAFIGEVRKLYRLLKILRDESFVKTGIANWNYMSQPDWFNYAGANPLDSINDIETNATILADPITGTSKTREEFLNEFTSGLYVNYQLIFSSVAGLVDALVYRKQQLEQRLFTEDADYATIKQEVEKNRKEVPSQGAIAGVYCTNDRNRGVWKSPANIAVQGIEKPVIEVSNREQDDLNVDATSGKSINVIRTFTGKGPLVWGARTLAGNDSEWRYISVRRFFSFAEESIKKSLQDFVFEPNTALTWVKIKAMITSFLVNQWQQGALSGATMDEAFFVKIGEDTTTQAEINNGIINIRIGLAAVRPAEFIVIEFNHHLKS